MEQGQLNWVANFIWGIADDVLRDLYVRGKYRDVILRITVLPRLDAVLEPTKQAVLEMKASLDKAGIANQDRVHTLITEDIPNRVAADKASQNAKQNSDKQNARIEHDKALARVMTAVLKDDTELFKQFMDNEGFRRWLTGYGLRDYLRGTAGVKDASKP